MSLKLSQNNPVSVTIGSLLYESVESFGMKVSGVGGGGMVSSQTVANDHVAVAHTHHPKEMELVVTVDAQQAEQDLIQAGYINLSGENAAIPSIIYKRKRGDERVQTVTFPGTARVSSCELKLVNVKGQSGTNPVTEITILYFGTVQFSSWVVVQSDPLENPTVPLETPLP